MDSCRLVLPELSAKQHDGSTPAGAESRLNTEATVPKHPLSARLNLGNADIQDQLSFKSGALTERNTRTARSSRPPTVGFLGGAHTHSSKSGALTERGDRQWHALKSSVTWRPKREARGPLVQFLLKSAWGNEAQSASLRGTLEDDLKEKCGEDPQTSARNAEAESLEIAVDTLQKSYNELKNTSRSKETHLAAISAVLRDLREEGGEAPEERSSHRLPELEDSQLLFLSRPSLAYMGFSIDEDPVVCADKMQALADDEERKLRIRIHCQQRYVLEKAKLLDQQKQQQELLRRLSIECADRSHSLQIQQEEEEKAKASIAVFRKQMEALTKARARVAEARAARHAAFRDLQLKLEERRKHKENVIQEINARTGMSLKEKAAAVERKQIVVSVLKELHAAVLGPRIAKAVVKDGRLVGHDLFKALKRHEDNENKHQVLQAEVTAAEAHKQSLQARKEALEAELHAAACLPARPSERDERAGRDTEALEQRQGAARRRHEKAVRKWAELETQVAAAVSGLEGLIHVLEARAPTFPSSRNSAWCASSPPHSPRGDTTPADVVGTLELLVKEVLTPALTSLGKPAHPAESVARPHPAHGVHFPIDTSMDLAPGSFNYRLGAIGPRGSSADGRRSSFWNKGITRAELLKEAYVEAKAAEARRVQSAAASKVAGRQKNGSKLQTQLTYGKKMHFKPPLRDAQQGTATLTAGRTPRIDE
ncbi:hypothetical protein KFL_001020090 [Klebsormidium nitens]|uniref:Uncharacterized protein n=1 Tax=Klebsormidium nitens TaxID=105231 RepID=A0A1Y1I206_KLENI|nr:hypothetical protein KFL_001020090 [Klebsormidium nitens]|eukprot:GAQ82158.1 hypothetical protein KFL_001020090 [Klebsormidium nitens]